MLTLTVGTKVQAKNPIRLDYRDAVQRGEKGEVIGIAVTIDDDGFVYVTVTFQFKARKVALSEFDISNMIEVRNV